MRPIALCALLLNLVPFNQCVTLDQHHQLSNQFSNKSGQHDLDLLNVMDELLQTSAQQEIGQQLNVENQSEEAIVQQIRSSIKEALVSENLKSAKGKKNMVKNAKQLSHLESVLSKKIKHKINKHQNKELITLKQEVNQIDELQSVIQELGQRLNEDIAKGEIKENLDSKEYQSNVNELTSSITSLNQISTPKTTDEDDTVDEVTEFRQKVSDKRPQMTNEDKLKLAIEKINRADNIDILHHTKFMKQVDHSNEEEHQGIEKEDLPSTHIEDFEYKKLQVLSENQFKQELHKSRSENNHMADFSSYNLDNIERKEEARAQKEDKDQAWKAKIFEESEKLVQANRKAKKDAERALENDLEMNLEAKMNEFDKQTLYEEKRDAEQSLQGRTTKQLADELKENETKLPSEQKDEKQGAEIMAQREAESIQNILRGDKPVPMDIKKQNEEYDKKMVREQKRIEQQEQKKEDQDEIVQEFLKANITSKDLVHAKKLDDMINNPDPVEDIDNIPSEQVQSAAKVKSLYQRLNQIEKNKKQLEFQKKIDEQQREKMKILEKIREAREEKKLQEIKQNLNNSKNKVKLSLDQKGSLVQKISEDKDGDFVDELNKPDKPEKESQNDTKKEKKEETIEEKQIYQSSGVKVEDDLQEKVKKMSQQLEQQSKELERLKNKKKHHKKDSDWDPSLSKEENLKKKQQKQVDKAKETLLHEAAMQNEKENNIEYDGADELKEQNDQFRSNYGKLFPQEKPKAALVQKPKTKVEVFSDQATSALGDLFSKEEESKVNDKIQDEILKKLTGSSKDKVKNIKSNLEESNVDELAEKILNLSSGDAFANSILKEQNVQTANQNIQTENVATEDDDEDRKVGNKKHLSMADDFDQSDKSNSH